MKHHYYPTKEKKLAAIIHTTIRTPNSIKIIDDKAPDRDEKLSSKSVTGHIHHHRNVFKNASIAPVVDKNLKMKSNQDNQYLSQDNTSNSKMSSINNHNNAKMISIQLDGTSPVNKFHGNAKLEQNRKCFGYYCCSYSPLCAVLFVFGGLLLVILIASIFVGLLTNTKTTTIETTTIKTTTIKTTTIETTTIETTTIKTTTIETTTVTYSTLSISSNDTIDGLWDTIAGGDSTLATPGSGVGNYVAAESPPHAFDRNCSTKYTNFGNCTSSENSPTCAINTGFYVTLEQGAVVMNGLQFCTGNDNPPRDPITMTLEGSNQNDSALMLGSSWSLIYNGSCGLDVDPGRNSLGLIQTFSNSIAYSSYRILITSYRSNNHCVQYGELYLFGY